MFRQDARGHNTPVRANASGPDIKDKVYTSEGGRIVLSTEGGREELEAISNGLVGLYKTYRMRLSENEQQPIVQEVMRIFRRKREVRFEHCYLRNGWDLDRFEGCVFVAGNAIWFIGAARKTPERLRIMLFRNTGRQAEEHNQFHWGILVSDIASPLSHDPAACRILLCKTKVNPRNYSQFLEENVRFLSDQVEALNHINIIVRLIERAGRCRAGLWGSLLTTSKPSPCDTTGEAMVETNGHTRGYAESEKGRSIRSGTDKALQALVDHFYILLFVAGLLLPLVAASGNFSLWKVNVNVPEQVWRVTLAAIGLTLMVVAVCIFIIEKRQPLPKLIYPENLDAKSYWVEIEPGKSVGNVVGGTLKKELPEGWQLWLVLVPNDPVKDRLWPHALLTLEKAKNKKAWHWKATIPGKAGANMTFAVFLVGPYGHELIVNHRKVCGILTNEVYSTFQTLLDGPYGHELVSNHPKECGVLKKDGIRGLRCRPGLKTSSRAVITGPWLFSDDQLQRLLTGIVCPCHRRAASPVSPRCAPPPL